MAVDNHKHTSAANDGGDELTPTKLNVDGGVLYVDDTNNRVGIGTASPAAPLDFGTNSEGGKPFILMYNDNSGVNVGFWRDTPSANVTAMVVNSGGMLIPKLHGCSANYYVRYTGSKVDPAVAF